MLNDTITVQARTFETDQEAEHHVRTVVAALAMPISEKVKTGSYRARTQWGDGGSTVYLALGVRPSSSVFRRRISRRGFRGRQRVAVT